MGRGKDCNIIYYMILTYSKYSIHQFLFSEWEFNTKECMLYISPEQTALNFFFKLKAQFLLFFCVLLKADFSQTHKPNAGMIEVYSDMQFCSCQTKEEKKSHIYGQTPSLILRELLKYEQSIKIMDVPATCFTKPFFCFQPSMCFHFISIPSDSSSPTYLAFNPPPQYPVNPTAFHVILFSVYYGPISHQGVTSLPGLFHFNLQLLSGCRVGARLVSVHACTSPTPTRTRGHTWSNNSLQLGRILLEESLLHLWQDSLIKHSLF